MKRAALSPVGRIDLVDVQAISDGVGRDFIPHPFAVVAPSRFASYQEYQAYVLTARERLHDGDLSDFAPWFAAYAGADIRVECVVSIVGAPRGRLLAHRRGQLGFLAAQRPDGHAVDVYTVSPYDLGSAIADSLALTQPGRHPKIVIPELIPRQAATTGGDEPGVSVRERGSEPIGVTLSRAQVTRYTRVQSRWQPAGDWGFDRAKSTVVCVAIKDDGDYICSPGLDYWTPLTAHHLGRRIDDSIAEDVAELRASRDG